MAIKRNYSKKFTIGDILYNEKDKTIFFYLKAGVFGSTKINLVKREDNTFDIMKPYFDREGQLKSVKLGKTFLATDKDSNVIEGITNGTLGLTTAWNEELKKEVTTTNNALYFSTHKLKEKKRINDHLIKVGWVTGMYGTEVEVKDTDGQPA